ncbi:MAG: histidinol-phosphate transaminase [Bacteroidia bacterium]|nr:histidinol-phosphate transaminase [Bacteroidia bacterium]
MFDLSSLVRPHILQLKPYASARDEYTGREGIFLDANENPFQSVAGGAYNRYPDPLQRTLKARIAALKQVAAERIFLGNGSDEPIDLLIRAFCEPGRDHIMLLPPTYGMYQVSADINRVETVPIPLTRDFQLDTEEIIASSRPATKLIFICSPNNPTANCMRQSDISLILRHAPGLVVVDEAYIDFAPDQTLTHWLETHPNLVILQTFSKAWGMAALRLGMGFAHPEVIAVLNKIKPPYNLSGLTQEVALEALDHADTKDLLVHNILEGRAWLTQQLETLPAVQQVFPSDANFILARITDADTVYHRLTDRQIIVRNRSRVILCEDCLRITVGTPLENEALIQALRAVTQP